MIRSQAAFSSAAGLGEGDGSKEVLERIEGLGEAEREVPDRAR